jgi:PPK2 family polyphosphate:nucleotide phosphotransferase
MKDVDLRETFRVEPGRKVRLKNFDTSWQHAKRLGGKDAAKRDADEILNRSRKELAEAQDLLSANDTFSILVVLQAMDAAGKDSTIKHVMSGVNPQGCMVFPFKQPSAEELDHNFLWRYAKALPERGRIGIFNRSYYEEVLVVRVHPELLGRQKLPPGRRGKSFWKDRYEDINAFERHLVRNGTVILKFFLHVSKKEQKERFLERLDNPDKNWKFSMGDAAERGHWEEYQEAYEDLIRATATRHAPWYVVPADKKWFTRVVVGAAIIDALGSLDLKFPEVDDEKKKELAAARIALERD